MALTEEREFQHQPVLLTEVLAFLDPRPGAVVVDATVGGGGHAAALLERLGPNGRLVGLDQDEDALAAARLKFAGKENVTLIRENFRYLERILGELGIAEVDAVLFDLGVSSPQFDRPERGFSYQADAPLDMRMDKRQALTAATLVNTAAEEELAQIIRTYGEERWAKRIAAFIVKARARKPIATTGELVALIKAAIPHAARRQGPHPARRTFQALRLAVNDELGALREALPAAIQALRPGGRVAVISFHSLEDRLCKQTFVHFARDCHCPPELPACVCGGKPLLKLLTRRPVTPTAAEIKANARARSAKLRVAEKL